MIEKRVSFFIYLKGHSLILIQNLMKQFEMTHLISSKMGEEKYLHFFMTTITWEVEKYSDTI